jgi:magnesium transporter
MQLRHRRAPTLDDVQLALEVRPTALRTLVERVHPADLAQWLQELGPDAGWTVFTSLSAPSRASLLEYAPAAVRERLVRRLDVGDLVALVERLPPDEVVDLLALVSGDVAEQVLRKVDLDRAAGLRQLARYREDSAGGIMTPHVDVFPEGTRVGDVIKSLRKEDQEYSDDRAGVFVVDAVNRPVGFVSYRELLTTPIHSNVESVMAGGVVTVRADDDQEHVAQVLAKYSLPSVPVVDDRGTLIGVVTADDALGVLEKEALEDFFKLVGAAPEQQTRLPIRRRVRQRLPLMGLTVLGGLLTAKILELAGAGGGGAEVSTVDLLRYVPIILGLAGNVGIQSATILVRGFATGEVALDREFAVVRSEVATGSTIGLCCGLATACVSAFTEANEHGPAWLFAVAIGVAILIAVTWAALLGCLVPLGCHRFGVDPAVVAGPFLITMSDVSGTGIFMLVAHLIVSFGGSFP